MYACKQLTRVKASGLTCQPPQSDHTMSADASCGSSWSDCEVRALIAIWGEDKIQEELDGAVRNQAIFDSIARKMQQKGYDRDWQQCRNKIKNLKKEYRQVKDNNGQTGRERKTCKFYKELDDILGHRPASVPAVLLDTGTTTNSNNGVESDSAEEREELVTNGIDVQCHYLQVLSYIKIVSSSTDGDDVHANSPLDSALISQEAEGSQAAGGTQSTTDDKEPGEEAGVGM